MNKCSNCNKPSNSLKTAIRGTQYLENMCDKCLSSFTESSVYARKSEREADKRKHEKDLIQRYEGDKINPEFVRAYPKESEAQWGKNILRELG